jgi:serine/threonine protein kinase
MQQSPTNLPDILDGYRLIRFLGRGGFGEVWLCRSEAMGDYRALKWIPSSNSGRQDKEYQALLHYRQAAAALRSPCLLPIEHVGRIETGLYYVMPLADGVQDLDPADPEWTPMSLATKLQARIEAPAWFSSAEVIGLIAPVLEGLRVLTGAGLVHRDVKPDNILFFHGKACLGDISLLGADATTITRHGTPGYTAPSWYHDGHPDMYGAAATLYSVLTGNAPDRMGRSAFLWPPQGEASLSDSDRSEWQRLHGVIRRAIEEKVSERYVDFRAMAAALDAVLAATRPPTLPLPPPANPTPSPSSRKKSHSSFVAAAVVLGLVAVGIIAFVFSPPPEATKEPESKTSPTPEVLPSAPIAQRPPQIVDMRGHFRSIREKVIESLPPAISTPSDGTVRLDLDEYAETNAILKSYESRDYEKCLKHLNQRLATHPELGDSRLFTLVRALVLKHLNRSNEMESLLKKIETPPKGGNLFDHNLELILLESLGKYSHAEKLVSTVIKVMPKKATTSDKINLYNLRARYQILTGNYAGALADENAALDLPPEGIPNRPRSKQENYQGHLNTIVMQWELLEQEFPAYAAYLEANGWPEPKPDHRNYKAED